MSLPNSPSGKLVQIEYALQAVAAGALSVGIRGAHQLERSIAWLSSNPSTIAKNGVVIAVEKKHKSPLYDETTVNKVYTFVNA